MPADRVYPVTHGEVIILLNMGFSSVRGGNLRRLDAANDGIYSQA